MAQPSVANYFSSRKRSAMGDLNGTRLKKAAAVTAASHGDDAASILAKAVSAMPIEKLESLVSQQQAPPETTQAECIEEVQQKTPPASPQKAAAPIQNAMDKVGKQGDLSLNQLKMKLTRSSRLAELKASMSRLKAGQEKLQKVEEKIRKIPDSPSLKAFKSIELEVTLSPVKVQSPEKPYLSPRKDTSARKNLLNLLSPTKNAVSIGARSSATKALFQSVPKPSLTLPFKYRSLAEMFRSIDTVAQILHNRKETITYRKLKPAVEEMIKRSMHERHLAQIMGVYPRAFNLKYEKVRVYGTGRKEEQWELLVVPNLSAREDGSTSMTADDLLERRRTLFDLLIGKTKQYHAEFVKNLDLPMVVDMAKVTRWHAEFDVNQVPDIEQAALPEKPVEDVCTTGQAVLEKAKLMFNCNTRMEQALKRLHDASDDKKTQAQNAHETKLAPGSSHLKGIPAALLERVRQRQAAKALESMTRTDGKEKELQHYGRLPELCRLTRNLFVAEKKSVLPLDIVVTKLDQSMRTYLTRDDLEAHLRTVAREFPKWLVFHEMRGTIYVKIAKNADLSVIVHKLESIVNDKTEGKY